MRIPQFVAHRGYPLHYPENTLIGLEAAIGAGARFLEIDVQLTQDRIPVVFHDHGLNRVCGVDGLIYEHSFEQLRAFRASERHRFGNRYPQVVIPSLNEFAELLIRNPATTAFVELKGEAIEHFGEIEVFKRVRQALALVASQCVLISYSLKGLATARAHGWPSLGVVIDHWNDRHRDAIQAIKPEYLFCDESGLPRQGKLHFENSKLAVFEITDGQIALNLAGRGVELIETFAIGELKRAVESLASK